VKLNTYKEVHNLEHLQLSQSMNESSAQHCHVSAQTDSGLLLKAATHQSKLVL
jgi:hypothetical protein